MQWERQIDIRRSPQTVKLVIVNEKVDTVRGSVLYIAALGIVKAYPRFCITVDRLKLWYAKLTDTGIDAAVQVFVVARLPIAFRHNTSTTEKPLPGQR